MKKRMFKIAGVFLFLFFICSCSKDDVNNVLSNGVTLTVGTNAISFDHSEITKFTLLDSVFYSLTAFDIEKKNQIQIEIFTKNLEIKEYQFVSLTVNNSSSSLSEKAWMTIHQGNDVYNSVNGTIKITNISATNISGTFSGSVIKNTELVPIAVTDGKFNSINLVKSK